MVHLKNSSADYTMMGKRLANDLLLLSRVWSRHIITYTFLNAHIEESLTPKLLSDLLPWWRVVPVHVSESVSKNMVIVSLQSSELDSVIKDPLVIPDLSSPECADHLVPSMYGHPSRSRLEGKGFLSSRTLKYGKSPQVCNQSVINQ